MGATLDGNRRMSRVPEGLSHQIPSPLEGVFATMRTRSTIASVVLATASVALLAGCSGKPENSPAIRTKFAQYDKAAASVEALTTEVQSLQTQVAALMEENSALRAFAPTVNGTPAIEKINSLEARLNKVEGLAGQSIMTAAASPRSTAPAATSAAAAVTNSNPDSLDTAPLAAAPAPKETAPAAVVASQQQRPKTAAAASTDSFRNLTNKPAETKPVAKTSTTPAAKPAAATKPTAAPAPAARGAYHTIETGDTLQGLSSKYGVPVDSILKANRIPQGARLARGQRLFIPQS